MILVLFKKYGIGVKFVPGVKASEFEAAIDEKTKALYVESIGNPKYNLSPSKDFACKHCVPSSLSDLCSILGLQP